MLKTEELIATYKIRWFTVFKEYVRSGCEQIRKLQDETSLSAIASMEFSMLYTNLLDRRYVADLFVYSEKLYLDKTQRFIDSYDISDIFVYFDKLWDDLLVLRKRYVGKVSARDITTLMLRTLPDFYSVLEGIARFAIAELADKSPFININKSEKFLVNVGDYMAGTHTVYTEWQNKDEIAQQLYDNPADIGILGDYSGLDFSGKDLSQLDLRYAQFRGSTLKETDFYSSLLTGANFRNANMEGCYIEDCSIFEADFSFANLKNASFMFSEQDRMAVEEEPRFPRLLPTHFHCADLTDADLNGANLTGADFTGANLTRADFTGANLTGADFTGAELTGAVFTDVKLTGAIFSEEITSK